MKPLHRLGVVVISRPLESDMFRYVSNNVRFGYIPTVDHTVLSSFAPILDPNLFVCLEGPMCFVVCRQGLVSLNGELRKEDTFHYRTGCSGEFVASDSVFARLRSMRNNSQVYSFQCSIVLS
jgi:hypothetical protein